MKRNHRRETATDRKASTPPARRAWAKPDFTKLSTYAEIGTYIFTA